MIDLAVLAVHVYAVAVGNGTKVFYVDYEYGYASVWGYAKMTWALLLLGLSAVLRPAWQTILWVPALAYLLADDALRVHEQVGPLVSRAFGLRDRLGPVGLELGQHLVTAAAAAVVLVPPLVGYLRGGAAARRVHRAIAAVLVLLACFGVGVDVLHVAVDGRPERGDWFGFVEDGGEMVVLTLVVALAAAVAVLARTTGGTRGGRPDGVGV